LFPDEAEQESVRIAGVFPQANAGTRHRATDPVTGTIVPVASSRDAGQRDCLTAGEALRR
jgi:hypothetical protein